VPVIPPTNFPFSSSSSSFCYCLTFFHSWPFPEKKKKKESSLANILHRFNSSADSLPGCLVCLTVRKEPGELDAGCLSFGKAFLCLPGSVSHSYFCPQVFPAPHQTSSKLIQGPRQWCYLGGFLKIQIPGSNPLSSESKSLRLEFRTGDAKKSF